MARTFGSRNRSHTPPVRCDRRSAKHVKKPNPYVQYPTPSTHAPSSPKLSRYVCIVNRHRHTISERRAVVHKVQRPAAHRARAYGAPIVVHRLKSVDDVRAAKRRQNAALDLRAPARRRRSPDGHRTAPAFPPERTPSRRRTDQAASPSARMGAAGRVRPENERADTRTARSKCPIRCLPAQEASGDPPVPIGSKERMRAAARAARSTAPDTVRGRRSLRTGGTGKCTCLLSGAARACRAKFVALTVHLCVHHIAFCPNLQ